MKHATMTTAVTGSMPAAGDPAQPGRLPRWLRLALIFTAAFALAFGAARMARADADATSAQSHMLAHSAPVAGEPIA